LIRGIGVCSNDCGIGAEFFQPQQTTPSQCSRREPPPQGCDQELNVVSPCVATAQMDQLMPQHGIERIVGKLYQQRLGDHDACRSVDRIPQKRRKRSVGSHYSRSLSGSQLSCQL
jgi:hypothetical protein